MASRLLKISSLRIISQRFSHATDYGNALSAIPATELGIIDNGVKVATQNTGGMIATVGICIDAGSRYEDKNNNGAANLLERLIFKGTAKRSQADLESEIGNLGARLSATTTREQTALCATGLSEDVPKLVEILSDVIQNAKLNDADVERERGVVLRELEDVEANIKGYVLENLYRTAYQGTAMSQSPVGPIRNIEKLGRNDLQRYVDIHFKAARTVLVAAGGVNHNELIGLAEKHLGKLDNTFDGEVPTLEKCRYIGSDIRVQDDSLPTAYYAIAVESCGWNSPDYVPMLLAKTIIGSWSRSDPGSINHFNRLAHVTANEKLAESYESFFDCYNDTSLWGTYVVCGPMQCDAIRHELLEAWLRLCFTVTDSEVTQAKNLLITNLLHQSNDTKLICEDIGRQVLALGHHNNVREMETAINSVTADHLRDVCKKYIDNQCPVVSAVGPIETLSDYGEIRTRMYWSRV